MKRLFALSLLLVTFASAALVGCGGGSETKTEPAKETPEKKTSKRPRVSNEEEETSPAEGSSEEAVAVEKPVRPARKIPASATPDQVLSAFLDSIKAGDKATTESLLTDTAREETRKANLSVSDTAAPGMTFAIGKPQYLKNSPGGAHVVSTWKETAEDGSEQSFEVTWVLRKEDAGWRICGLAIELIPGGGKQFLNFEDPSDMEKKQQEAVAQMQQMQEEEAKKAQDAAIAEGNLAEGTVPAEGAEMPAEGEEPAAEVATRPGSRATAPSTTAPPAEEEEQPATDPATPPNKFRRR